MLRVFMDILPEMEDNDNINSINKYDIIWKFIIKHQ